MTALIMLALKDQHAPAILDDFLSEEVTDKSGTAVGTLSCYWESNSGQLFLGVEIKNQSVVRVVPGAIALLDDRHSCIRVSRTLAAIESAPVYDCDKEMYPRLEVAANKHFNS